MLGFAAFRVNVKVRQTLIIAHFCPNFKEFCQFKLTLERKKILAGDKISLDRLIAKRRLRKDMIADELGIVLPALNHKLKGRRRFTEQELIGLSPFRPGVGSRTK